jgi:hypothetical protein
MKEFVQTINRPTLYDQDISLIVSREIAENINKNGMGGDVGEMAEDIFDVISGSPYADGYVLAKTLEDDHHWDGVDLSLAEELDYASSILSGYVREKTALWVKQNDIRPKRGVGDIVEIKMQHKKYTGEIVKIDAEQAEYVVFVEECGHVKSGQGTNGFIIKFEEIHDLAASPEDFRLAIQ